MYYLCRLYKSLGDYDVLHGVFSRQIGTKSITQEALEAEERRDYFEALRLYKEVICSLVYTPFQDWRWQSMGSQ